MTGAHTLERPRTRLEGDTDLSAQMQHAFCRRADADPELWFSSGLGDRALAKHLCLKHCPALAACRALTGPEPGAVIAGESYSDHRDPHLLPITPATRCDVCKYRPPGERM